jgi:LacI family transcriptional regulator
MPSKTTAAAARLESRPKYRVVQDLIREGVRDGSLTRDGKLPSEHDLARRFGVAYMTLRAAVNALVQEGLLRRIHGKGTFVAPPPADAGAPVMAAGSLALLVPSLPALWNVAGLYYFPPIVQGFSAEATRRGFEPSVLLGGAKDAFASGASDLSRVAGVACLMITHEDTAALEALRDGGLPLVGINAYPGRRAISRVFSDQAGGMASAVRMLAERGHRRIAFLPGPPGNLGAEARQKGLYAAVAVHGLECVAVDAEPADYTDVSGALRTRRMLATAGERPTAIVAAGDLIAAGALQAIREAGLRVPQDISVVGFGDFQIAQHVQPALTTVRLPLFELGEQAATLLAGHVAGVTRHQVVTLPAELVERDSVGPPAPD